MKEFNPGPAGETRNDSGRNVDRVNIETVPGLFGDVAAPGSERKANSILYQSNEGATEDLDIAAPREGS